MENNIDTDIFLDNIAYTAVVNLYTLSKNTQKICLYQFYGSQERVDHLALLWCAKLVEQIHHFPIYVECTWRESRILHKLVPIQFKRMPRKLKKLKHKNCDEIIYDIESANAAFGIFKDLYKRYWQEREL